MGIASPGNLLLAFDLSQAESWIVAHLAEEANMKDALINADIHTRTAQIIFKKQDIEKGGAERYMGKQTNHATSYGEAEETMAKAINKKSDEPPFVTVSVRQCKQYQAAWHDYYKNIKGVFWPEIQEQLRKNRTLVTPYDRERMFFAEWGNKLFQEGYAYIPQSTVADHFNGAVQKELGIEGGLLRIHKILIDKNPEIKIINQSHDSIMIDCPREIANEVQEIVFSNLYRPILIKGETFFIPVDGEIGERWGELEKVPKWQPKKVA